MSETLDSGNNEKLSNENLEQDLTDPKKENLEDFQENLENQNQNVEENFQSNMKNETASFNENDLNQKDEQTNEIENLDQNNLQNQDILNQINEQKQEENNDINNEQNNFNTNNENNIENEGKIDENNSENENFISFDENEEIIPNPNENQLNHKNNEQEDSSQNENSDSASMTIDLSNNLSIKETFSTPSKDGRISSLIEGSTQVKTEFSDSDDISQEYKHMPVSCVIRGIQEVLLWRRPLALFFVVFITELMFYAIYTLNLDAFSTLFVLLISIHCVCLLYSISPKFIQNWIFPPIGEITMDDKVVHAFDILKERKRKIQEWAINYINHPNIIDSILFIGTSILLFTIFLVVGSFWSSFIVINSLFIVPAFFLNPMFRKKVDGKIRAARDAVIQKEKVD